MIPQGGGGGAGNELRTMLRRSMVSIFFLTSHSTRARMRSSMSSPLPSPKVTSWCSSDLPSFWNGRRSERVPRGGGWGEGNLGGGTIGAYTARFEGSEI